MNVDKWCYIGSTFVKENPEYLSVTLDSSGKVIEGIQENGMKYLGAGMNIGGNEYYVVENPEWIRAIIDSEEKILCGIKQNGKFYADIDGIDEQVKELIQPLMDEVDDLIAKFDEIFKLIESPEFLSVELDSEEKVLGGRKIDGTKFENVGIETNHLELTEQGMTDFQQALKNAGFNPGGTGDWSDYISNDGDNPLCLAEPRCAMMNIISNADLSNLLKKGMSGAVKGVNYDVPCQVEWFDMQGNYFKKWVEMSGQGNSSMMFPQKNIAMDFFDDETRDGAFKFKIGNWVSQDSYHFKAFYSDYLKGVGIIAYKIAMQAQRVRGIFKDISWKRALIDESAITDKATDYEISDFDLSYSEARCMPDGFPIIVYQNGEFYGIFVQSLKKHRDNYHMNKSTATHIHLDDTINNATMFNGVVDWTKIEPRNPKDLYYKVAHNGTYKYDADSPGQFEIADTATVNAWIAAGQFPDGTPITSKIEKQLKTTAKVHTYIENLASRKAQINAASTVSDKKALFETYFDVDSIVDYLLINMALSDGDGFGPNWQWTTWDGIKWSVNEYDKDNTFGNNSKGFIAGSVRNPITWIGMGVFPTEFVINNYSAELKSHWNELVAAGIFTADNFMKTVLEWLERIGYDNLKRHYLEKWTESPCFRDPGISPNWDLVAINYAPGREEMTYDPNTTYNIGDTCQICQEVYNIVFECKVDGTKGIFPCKVYTYRPIYLGFYDNIWRIKKFIDKNLQKVNEFINQI